MLWDKDRNPVGDILLNAPLLAMAQLGSGMFMIDDDERLTRIDPIKLRLAESEALDANFSGLVAFGGALFLSDSVTGEMSEVRYQGGKRS